MPKWLRLFRSRSWEHNVSRELQFHIAERIASLKDAGLTEGEARRQVRGEFGGIEQVKESCRDAKGTNWLENCVRDVRFAVRMLARFRTASAAAVLSLALAIGAATTAFTLVDALLLRSLPLPAPHELFDLAILLPSFFSSQHIPQEDDMLSFSQYESLRDGAAGRAELFALSLTGSPQPARFDDAAGGSENVRADAISGTGFRTLGVKASLGRLLEPRDDSVSQSTGAAVLSDAFWRRRFGASPAVIGRWLAIGRKQFQIVGVTSASFSGLQPGYLTDVWLPLSSAVEQRILQDPDRATVHVWGRLRSGHTRSEIRQPLQAILSNFLHERIRVNPPRMLHGAQLTQFAASPLHVRECSRGLDSLFRVQFRRPLYILALICALLLLIACANVANLMLARSATRAAEMSLRVSLGASRSRLIQQMLVEGALQSFAGGALGLLFAAFAAPAIVYRLGSTGFPAWLRVAPDNRTVVFAMSISLLAAFLFGLLPALRASIVAPGTALKEAALQHSSRLGPFRWMLAAQIGFSIAVLFLGGLLLLSFRNLLAVDLGFAPENVTLFDLAPRDPASQHPVPPANLFANISSAPFVESAGMSRVRPMGGDLVWISTPIVRFPGQAAEAVRPVDVPVYLGFFHAMRMRWIAGRDFLPFEMLDADAASTAVVVNEAFVKTYLTNRDPLGQIFDKVADDPSPVKQQIVEVVGDALVNNLRESAHPTIYTPLRDAAQATVAVRMRPNTATSVSALRRRIETAVPELQVRASISLTAQVADTLLSERLLALVAGFFSIVTLMLVSVGVYGVLNYLAIRRTHEIGIRIALGAPRSSVVRLVFAHLSIPLGAGISAGIFVGLALSRYVASLLFAIKATDFWSLAAPLICIATATVVATLPPVFRAAGTDPLQTLRDD